MNAKKFFLSPIESRIMAITELNMSEAITALVPLIMSDTPCLMLGAPGSGKTQIASHAGKTLVNADHFDDQLTIIFSQTPPIEEKMPYVKDGRLAHAYSDLIDFEKRLFIIIDEIADLPAYESAIANQLILERRWGGRPLFPGSYVMACGNRAEHGAAAQTMASHTLGRFCVLHVKSNWSQWRNDWAIKNDIDNRIITFGDCQMALDGTDITEGFNQSDFSAGCTSRDLAILSNMEKQGIPDNRVGLALCQGKLGEDLGQRYHVFRSLSGVDITSLLADPSGASLPDELAELYAMIGYLANGAAPANWAAISTIAQRLDKPMAIGLISDCVTRNPKLKSGSVWTNLITVYGDLI